MTIYDIKFNDDHDMYLDGGDIAFTDEDTVVVQRLKIRLQFLFNEWFLDTTKGLPYTQFILEQGSSIEDIYTLFKREILQTDGVENLQSLEFTQDLDNKGLRVDFAVNDGISTGTVEVSI
jgi:hypothetical protein